MAEQYFDLVGDSYRRSPPAINEQEALRQPTFGPLCSGDGSSIFPDLKIVRAFRKEHCAIRHAQEILTPAQVRGLFVRASAAGGKGAHMLSC